MAHKQPSRSCPLHFDYRAPVWLLPDHLAHVQLTTQASATPGTKAQAVYPPDDGAIDPKLEEQADRDEARRDLKRVKVEPDADHPRSSSSCKEDIDDTVGALEKDIGIIEAELASLAQERENMEVKSEMAATSSKKVKLEMAGPVPPKEAPPAHLLLNAKKGPSPSAHGVATPKPPATPPPWRLRVPTPPPPPSESQRKRALSYMT